MPLLLCGIFCQEKYHYESGVLLSLFRVLVSGKTNHQLLCPPGSRLLTHWSMYRVLEYSSLSSHERSLGTNYFSDSQLMMKLHNLVNEIQIFCFLIACILGTLLVSSEVWSYFKLFIQYCILCNPHSIVLNMLCVVHSRNENPIGHYTSL